VSDEAEGSAVERARAGDEAAFGELFQRHAPNVSRLCRRMLGPGVGAEDACQEVFFRAQQAIGGFEPGRPFRAWLLAIAGHYCVDQLRRRGREQELFDPRDLDAAGLSDPGPSPLHQVFGREERAEILGALDALPHKYRLPLLLRYFNDLEYDGIAAVLGVSRGQVGTLLFRAKRALRARLAGGERPGHGVVRRIK
jgi:RNA polymerase sigma-70 factor (ECF subfamily)